MVKSVKDIMDSIKERYKDDTSDEAIQFIEDVSDTINDLDSRASEETNWKQKYEENDKEWREKYKERFFNSTEIDQVDDRGDEKPMKYEDLFK